MADTAGQKPQRKSAPQGAARQKAATPPKATTRARTAAKAAPAKAAPTPRLGVIADTHGYLDPQVVKLFAGVAHIIHAGDTGDAGIIAELAAVAPVSVVAGNIEPRDLTDLPKELAGQVAGVRFVVGHKRKRLLKRLAAHKVDLEPAGGEPNLVVCGHEHAPSVLWLEGVLHLNPGTASSPEEEDDGPTVAIVEADAAGLAVRFIPLRRRPEAEDAPQPAKAKKAASAAKPSAAKAASGKGKPAK
jgi:uncharacterized protein